MSLVAVRTVAWEVHFGRGDRALFQEQPRAAQYASVSHGVIRELVDRHEAEQQHEAEMEALRKQLAKP